MKRKHTLIVEITLDQPDTEKAAAQRVQGLLYAGRVHLGGGGKTYLRQQGDPRVKSFERATSARARRGNTLAAARATALALRRDAEQLKVLVAKLEEQLP